MIDEYYFNEIMKIPSDNSVMLMRSLSLLKEFKIELTFDKNYNVFYRVKIEDILNSDIENETLIEIRNGGWKIDETNEYLIKYIDEHK